MVLRIMFDLVYMLDLVLFFLMYEDGDVVLLFM